MAPGIAESNKSAGIYYKADPESDAEKVIDICERIEQHLTAAVVSNNQNFLDKVLGMTVNGTTYADHWSAIELGYTRQPSQGNY